MDALERWAAKAHAEVVLPSGTKVRLHLTTIRDLILAGGFDASVIPLARAIESGTVDESKVMSDEDFAQLTRFQHSIIAEMVEAIDGEDVDLTPEDVARIPAQDVEDLWAYHIRLKAFPQPAAD